MNLKDIPQLKSAILDLPQKEKDKLLLRLIAKDKTLVEHLHFQLLEDENDLIERTTIVREKIDNQFKKSHNLINKINIVRSHRQLLLTLKSMSGIINYHVQITKDKTSEFELRKYVLLESFNRYPYLFTDYTTGINAEKLYQYQEGRLKLLDSLFSKFHEDLQYDFKEDMESIDAFISKTHINFRLNI